MTEQLDRRGFVVAGGAATVGFLLSGPATAQGGAPREGAGPETAAPAATESAAAAPAVITRRSSRPVVVASDNGNTSRGPDGRTCVQTAYEMITGGADVLDALVAGVNIVELDPEDTSVGYGGLPNGDGVVQLDASVMHGPKRQAGAVAALEGVRTPSLVARAVMQMTDHHLLVGADAQRFARQLGFTIEDDLNTEQSRRMWLEWRRRIDRSRWLDPAQRGDESLRIGLQMVKEGLIDGKHLWGTIHCSGVSAAGEVCGVTTTSGLAWKIPGRVGDSPILGAGLYVAGDVGAAGSTGRGEANLFNLSSYAIVENMRRGMSPLDAGMEACRRIQQNTVERRLLNGRGLPNFNIQFYVLNASGAYAGVTLYGDAQFSVCDADGPRMEDCVPVLAGSPED